MPNITVNVDDDLKDRMEQHPEINWSEVTRQAIQKKISLYATAAVACHSQRSRSSVPSPVGFKVYQWVTDQLDADQMTRETYVKYVKELSTYGLISTSRKSRGRGGGMYMEFTFTGDPEAMMNRIVDDTRMEAVADQEELLRTVVNSQLREFHN